MKIEDLKVGDELICVEYNHPVFTMEETYTIKKIDGAYFEFVEFDGYWMNPILECFKKKEQPTFNDLIDVAYKGFRDHVLFELHMDNRTVGFRISSDFTAGFDENSVEAGINLIKSLYKETFVIETESDTRRLKDCAKVKLANGEQVIFSNSDGYSHHFIYGDSGSACIPFIALKGATVEQGRGTE